MRTRSGIKNFYKFFKGYYIVIVEGPDDFVFWRNYFPADIKGLKLKIKPVGGKPSVNKYIEVIKEDKAPYIAIIDSDYDAFQNNTHNHDLVIETSTYSIENLMVCKCKVSKIISGYTQKDKDYQPGFEKALDQYDECILPLMCADYFLKNIGAKSTLMSGACLKYLKTGNYVKEISKKKILNEIKKHKVKDIQKLTDQYKDLKPRFYSNGHFFFGFVCAYMSSCIKSERSVPNIQNLTYFNQMTDHVCQSCIKIGYLQKIIESIEKAVNQLTEKLISKNVSVST